MQKYGGNLNSHWVYLYLELKFEYSIHSFLIRTNEFLLKLGCSYFFGTFTLKLFLSCSHFQGTFGYFRYFWVCTLISLIWSLFYLQLSNSRLRIVLKLFLFFGAFEQHCSYKIVLIEVFHISLSYVIPSIKTFECMESPLQNRTFSSIMAEIT